MCTISEMRSRLVLAAFIALLATGCRCESTAPQRPVTPSEWKSVIRDSYDGKIDHAYRCAAVQAAYVHIPHDNTYSGIPGVLLAFEKKVC